MDNPYHTISAGVKAGDPQANPYNAPVADVAFEDETPKHQPRFLSFAGRIGRLRYLSYSWHWFLLTLLVLFIVTVAVVASIAGSPRESEHLGHQAGRYLFFVSVIGALPPTLRRLRDLNLSPWFSPLVVVPLLGQLIWLLLCLIPGNDEANDHGLAPAGNTNATIFGACATAGAWVLIVAAIVKLVP